MSTHTEGSPIATNRQQMYELKRVHECQNTEQHALEEMPEVRGIAIGAFGESAIVNQIPGEYKKKATTMDRKYGIRGQNTPHHECS